MSNRFDLVFLEACPNLRIQHILQINLMGLMPFFARKKSRFWTTLAP